MSNYKTTRQQIIDVPVPQQTRTYKPITNSQLIDLTLNSIDGAGFKLANESYNSCKDGAVSNGRYTLRDVADSEMQIMIGWQNSYDKSKTLKFAIGTRIFICDNGCVHGDMGAFKKKHQGEVQEFTPKTIIEYIKRAGDVFTQMQKERDAMKTIILDSRTKAELLGRMFIEEEFIHSTQLNAIKRELKTPSFDYNCPDSLWELYQHATHSMKDVHPTLWMDNHIKAHSFFVNQGSIIVPKITTSTSSGPHPQLNIFEEAVELYPKTLNNLVDEF